MSDFVASDGVRLAYRVVGEGPALILHMGAGCDSRLWTAAGYAEPLSRSYSCVLFDHRGHGASDKPRGSASYRIDRLTDDLVELLDHLKIDSAAFWGYSSGISPGVRLAEREPERTWALIGSGSVGPPDTPEELARWVTETTAEFRAHGWERLIERFERQERTPIPEWMTASIRATDVEQYVDLVASCPDWHWEEWDVLPTLRVPTLFLTGELEDPDDAVGAMVDRMPKAERVRLTGLGHINAFLATTQVLPRVERFLDRHRPRGSSAGDVH
ncbi:MAG TPA: alpha/beta hydrolase [Candidatus Limnocylindrales bacterium]